MVDQEYLEDIERLENRMRTNFFEIEKRLTSLETRDPGVSIGAEEPSERVQEIEDLQMLLQAEMLQLKQQILGEGVDMPSGDISKRLDKLEEVVSKGIQVSVSNDISRRVENLERMKDTGEVRKIINEMNEKINVLKPSLDEKRIIAEIENKIKSMKPAQDNKQRDEIENLYRRVEEFEKSMKESIDSFNKKTYDMENMIENSGKVLTEQGMKTFLNRIGETKAEIYRKIDDFESARDRMDRLFRERQNLIEKVDEIQIGISKADAMLSRIRTESAKAENAVEKISSIEERIENMMEEKMGKTELLRSELFERSEKNGEILRAEIEKSSSLREEISSMAERLGGGLEKIEEINKNFDNAVENSLRPKIAKITEEVVEKGSTNFDDSRIASLEMEIEKIKSSSNVERVYDETSKYVNDYMKRFSAHIDEKLGRISPTGGTVDLGNLKRELYKELYDELSRKMPAGNSRVSEVLLNKISSLESQITRLQNSLRSNSNMNPIILE